LAAGGADKYPKTVEGRQLGGRWKVGGGRGLSGVDYFR
jgi:hypothetical protein